MGTTVAPKMFSQPGVFGTSDTTAVVNKTNPMAGLAAGAYTPPAAAPVSPASSSTSTNTPLSTSTASSDDSDTPVSMIRGMNALQRSRMLGIGNAFYGY